MTLEPRSPSVRNADRHRLEYAVKFRNPDVRLNVYCLYAMLLSGVEKGFDPRIAAFGDTAVLFLNVDEFLSRIDKALEGTRHQERHSLVRYIDEDAHNGPMNPFIKSSRFAYQSEARIVVSPGRGEPWAPSGRRSVGHCPPCPDRGSIVSELRIIALPSQRTARYTDLGPELHAQPSCAYRRLALSLPFQFRARPQQRRCRQDLSAITTLYRNSVGPSRAPAGNPVHRPRCALVWGPNLVSQKGSDAQAVGARSHTARRLQRPPAADSVG